jgi:xanthine dehydrogenase accessory factor
MANHPLTCDVHRRLLQFLDAGEDCALVTVLKDSGSTPRKAGTKAIVNSRGDIWGTIGGGLLEVQAQRLAVDAIRTKQPAVFDFEFVGMEAAGPDPVCGGKMRVLVDPTVSGHRLSLDAAIAAMDRREDGTLVTTVGRTDLLRVQMKWLPRDVSNSPSTNGHAVAAIAEQTAQYFTGNDPGTSQMTEGLVESVVPTPLLIVCGGGHVGQALAHHANLVGFDVVAVEDRAEYARPELFPPEIETRCGKVSEVLAELPITRHTYIAIVGRGHLVDAQALAACIDKPAAYIGMMGSRRKIALLRKDFIESGRATAEQLDRVYAPIGLNLGAQTVPEIAASIVAQLIAVRRTGKAPCFDEPL